MAENFFFEKSSAKKISVDLQNTCCPVFFERGGISRVGEYFDLDRRVLIITDDGVPSRYAETVSSVCRTPYIFRIKQGENSKSMDVLTEILSFMLENGFDRSDCAVSVGGGVCSDLAGFAASCYMRGIDFYSIPTTLLAQADASVGGKTAVDLCGVKNSVGAFYQPRGIIIDTEITEKLPPHLISEGMAEIIKISLILDAELFSSIEKTDMKGLPSSLPDILFRAISLKAKTVEFDEREAGIRKILNFGHTLGHGIEAVCSIPHGYAVALGMLPMCSAPVKERLIKVLEAFSLPTKLNHADAERIFAACIHDKKKCGDAIATVRVDEIGKYEFKYIDGSELKHLIFEISGS